jgi:hypothetical protein
LNRFPERDCNETGWKQRTIIEDARFLGVMTLLGGDGAKVEGATKGVA